MRLRRFVLRSGSAAVLMAVCLLWGATVPTKAEPPKKASANAWSLDEAAPTTFASSGGPLPAIRGAATREPREARAGGLQPPRTTKCTRRVRRHRPALLGRSVRHLHRRLAVQESLQLDTMRGERPGRNRRSPIPPNVIVPKGPFDIAPKKLPEKVEVATLAGPAVQSHPWAKMLGSKKPEVGVLANCVPEDFYFAEFRNVARLNDVAGLSEVWGGHVFTQALGESRSQATLVRIKKQLGMFELPPAAVESLEIEGIAVAGSDLFLAEGSDVTVLVLSRKVPALLQPGRRHPEIARQMGRWQIPRLPLHALHIERWIGRRLHGESAPRPARARQFPGRV